MRRTIPSYGKFFQFSEEKDGVLYVVSGKNYRPRICPDFILNPYKFCLSQNRYCFAQLFSSTGLNPNALDLRRDYRSLHSHSSQTQRSIFSYGKNWSRTLTLSSDPLLVCPPQGFRRSVTQTSDLIHLGQMQQEMDRHVRNV